MRFCGSYVSLGDFRLTRDFVYSLKAILLLIMLHLTEEIGDKSFIKTLDANRTVMCAVEEPSLVFESHRLAVQSTGTTCVPPGMHCAWKCNLEPNCTNFNYKEDLGRCELFFYTPRNCTSIQFCSHSEMKGLGSCRERESTQPSSCSFPFTYNGRLYYNCTLNTTNSSEIGCFSENRVWITCPPFQLNYVAQNVTVNITIPTFDIPTPVLSVDNWIVIQQRIDNCTDFNRNWSEYRNGFGFYNQNYWMGLEKMHQLTNSRQHKLRMEVYYPTLGEWRSAEYQFFLIGAEANKYSLNVSGFSGDADDGLQSSAYPSKIHNGMPFSSPDVDHDNDAKRHCAALFSGGWWFNACCYVHLNGFISSSTSSTNYFEYYVGGVKTAVQMSRMMIRRV